MRGLLRLGTLVAAAALTAGCASSGGAASSLASAAAKTARGSSRVALSMSMHSQGMSLTFTQSGAFDYAHSTGYLRSAGRDTPLAQEVFLPPHVYIKMPGGFGGPASRGKTWVDINLAGAHLPSGLPFAVSPYGMPADPSEILSALEGVSSHVTQAGSATIRGVQTVHYRAMIDLAKALAKMGRNTGPAAAMKAQVTAQVWVDATGLVRRVSVAFTPGKHSGMPAGAQFTETADFFDFGVPVHVSAPPASEIMPPSQAFGGPGGSGGPGRMAPPPASGTLSPAQASAAEQAVRAFWAGVGAADLPAASRAVLPAQRKCFLSSMKHTPRITVASLRISSARPDKTGHATVLFTATLRVHVQGHSISLTGPAGSRQNWLVATADGSGWYVDLANSPLFPFAGTCGSIAPN
jgi:hypothetical protein